MHIHTNAKKFTDIYRPETRDILRLEGAHANRGRDVHELFHIIRELHGKIRHVPEDHSQRPALFLPKALAKRFRFWEF